MADIATQPLILAGEGWDDYGLVDSGHGRKLERYGSYRFVRPEPQAMWTPRLENWDSHGEFVPGSDEDGGGRWLFDKMVPREGWPLAWNEVGFTAQCTPFRHLGFFPDMAPVWDWMRDMLAGQDDASTLNLFGYTGVGTLALSAHGPVTHVDASKKSVAQARENAELAGLGDRPVRWLIDDAAKFTAREVRRGKRYDGIILDPPKFGRGPTGETWRLEENLPGLLADCRQLLDADSKFLFLTVYAVRMSSLALAGLMEELFRDLPGTIEHGDLAVREDGEGRLLPTAIFARWRNNG
ncbi:MULTISPECIES: class I SAM-dependent methyltransferase [unclassified Novosphingobium]|uniref:class I SAM-dependent methyltransferase n=1 Tax=unclassified Novosphingobium TaxID=2644732 RepID=UPI0006C87812|nr:MULTISPECIES: class I SAM-dependent methyltransferase [unclassified Novosphingobium]KPH64396.1 SAM-dependent methyltransferase [Novosphingobium sp. ST904]MPS70370.1 class I SAM-dependent rRNA methyltransferase [Novosphingobium sp.]TCM37402.1 23S rRNA (cytosine1962-C5)-methyltransferase [Novosphingobium sp. ST904]